MKINTTGCADTKPIRVCSVCNMLEIAHRMDNTGHDYVPASYPLQPEISRLAEENERLRALLAAVVKWSDDREVSIALVEDIRAALAGREEGSK